MTEHTHSSKGDPEPEYLYRAQESRRRHSSKKDSHHQPHSRAFTEPPPLSLTRPLRPTSPSNSSSSVTTRQLPPSFVPRNFYPAVGDPAYPYPPYPPPPHPQVIHQTAAIPDPRSRGQLPSHSQYSLVVEGSGGPTSTSPSTSGWASPAAHTFEPIPSPPPMAPKSKNREKSRRSTKVLSPQDTDERRPAVPDGRTSTSDVMQTTKNDAQKKESTRKEMTKKTTTKTTAKKEPKKEELLKEEPKKEEPKEDGDEEGTDTEDCDSERHSDCTSPSTTRPSNEEDDLAAACLSKKAASDGESKVDVRIEQPTDSAHSAPNTAPARPEGPVSTWGGPPVVLVKDRTGRRGGHFVPSQAVNGVAVPNPRPWGRKLEKNDNAPAESPPVVPSPDDGGWGDNRLKQWVDEVKQEPSVAPSDISIPPPNPPSPVSTIPSRPNSARENPPPVKVYYSDDESVVIIKRKPPRGKGLSEATFDKVANNDSNRPGSRQATAYPADPPDPRPRPRSFSRQSVASTQVTTATGSMRQRRPFIDNYSQKDKWWKKEIHPIWCPSFANRRITVRTQFPIRKEELKRVMFDHFSRYGAIRCAVPDGYDNTGTDKVIVVFRDEGCVERVFADPNHESCEYRSTYSRTGTSLFQLKVFHYPLPALSYVWVRVSGERFDARSRSASPIPPSRDDGGWGEERGSDTRTLPESISVYAVPRFLNKPEVWVYRATIIKEPIQVFKEDHSFELAGKEPILLATFPVGRRVLEKDFLPQLVEYFVDVFETVPPHETSKGWVFGVASDVEAKYLMEKLSVVPGITARFARSGDRQNPNAPLPPSHKTPSTHTDDDNKVASVQSSPANVAVVSPHAGLPLKPAPPLPHFDDPHYPHLVPQVMLTYRGRLIREEVVDGQPRYIDDAAIFVGRLVKEQENTMSLLSRFERYGKIVSVEYNPVSSQCTYGTARVLFQDAAAAKEAIEWENGAVSFGSAIKVEPRKVLPMDVQARKMYVDAHGRAISPSMAHQYTPPSPTDSAPRPSMVEPSPMQLPQPVNQYPQSWYSVMGPQFQWPAPMLPPPLPAGQPPNVQSEIGHPTQNPPPMMPMMCHLGIGFYSYPYPMEPPKPLFPAPLYPIAPVTSAGPAVASGGPPKAPGLGNPIATSAPKLSTAQPPVSASMAALSLKEPSVPIDQPTTNIPVADKDLPSGTGDTTTKSNSSDSQEHKPQLRAVETKFEDGILKVIYDPEELKQWRQENHITDRPATPAVSVPPPPTESPVLTLLPLATGGHEPRSPAERSEFGDFHKFLNTSLPPRPEHVDASGWSSGYMGPTATQFPDPVGFPSELNLPRMGRYRTGPDQRPRRETTQRNGGGQSRGGHRGGFRGGRNWNVGGAPGSFSDAPPPTFNNFNPSPPAGPVDDDPTGGW